MKSKNLALSACLFLLFSLAAQARRIDYIFLEVIKGTKWELVEEKEMSGLFHRKNTVKQEVITFSDGSILFDREDVHYACNYTVKKRIEFWLFCLEPDQYIYKIHKLNNRRLVMDVLAKNKDGSYTLKKRSTYARLMS
jgi:hypothetical protein